MRLMVLGAFWPTNADDAERQIKNRLNAPYSAWCFLTTVYDLADIQGITS